MSKEKVTVVIPTFNRAAFIEQAIRSVLEQTYPRWKLLIVDDASTDDTIARITPYLSDPRIRLLSLPKNSGISQVMNQALESVDTEAFVQLDSDDWLEKDALKLLVKAMKKDRKAALYYGNIRLWKENSTGNWQNKGIIHHRNFNNKYEFLTYMTYMLHPRCYRTEAVKKSGGWDVDDAYGGRIMEDRRMCVKLIENYHFHWINKVLYNRRKHREQLTNSEEYHKRNHLRRELVTKSLQRWGDRYRPVFGYRGGLLIVKSLVPMKRKQAGD